MIRRCEDCDFELIWAIINDGAQVYKGMIPADCWAEPYMSREKLRHEIAEGVLFSGYEHVGTLRGVMGIQRVRDVTLIRHAYVRTANQGLGIGGRLLTHLQKRTEGPMLVGTWADATWAIHFYERHGFRLVAPEQKNRLLREYWTVPDRQIETSVVLADPKGRQLSLRVVER
jgi:N-acetylglutamate synthase-like GNAT family acetyltransferase